jgi:outer membrane lipoprotein-sorting protein
MNSKTYTQTSVCCGFFIFVFLFLFLANNAVAYVLKGEHILELMRKQVNACSGLMVSQQLLVYGNGSEDDISEFYETVRYKFPYKFRSDIIGHNIERIHVVSNKQIITVLDGKFATDTQSRFDLYKDIFLYGFSKLLNQRLIELGVDTSVSSFGRFLEKTAYVVGAQYPDESVSQIWFDKETLLPLRWLMVEEDDDYIEDTLDIRYLKWTNAKRVWYPSKIEFYKNDNLLREININKTVVNPLLSEKLFDIEYLKSTYVKTLSDDPQNQEMREIRETVDDFKKIYE